MSEKFQTIEKWAVTATLDGEGEKDDIVTVTGDKTVSKAGAGDTPFGYIRWAEKYKAPLIGIETFFDVKYTVVFSETVQAGDWVKIGTPDGNGNQRHAKWIEGTDAESLKCGYVFSGGTADSQGIVLK